MLTCKDRDKIRVKRIKQNEGHQVQGKPLLQRKMTTTKILHSKHVYLKYLEGYLSKIDRGQLLGKTSCLVEYGTF